MSCVSPTGDEVVVYVEVRCRACFAPGLIRTSVERPPGGWSAVAHYRRSRSYEQLRFSCIECGHVAADLVDVTEGPATVVVPQRNPYPNLGPSSLMGRCVPASLVIER